MRKQIKIPSRTTLEGKRDGGTMWVESSGKPPKLRFQPGSFVRMGKKVFKIIYCFRVQSNPTEWYYQCEERIDLVTEPKAPNPFAAACDSVAKALGAGEETPRVVYDIFRDFSQAHQFFFDIPCNGSAGRDLFSNKQLLQQGEMISSGDVLLDV